MNARSSFIAASGNPEEEGRASATSREDGIALQTPEAADRKNAHHDYFAFNFPGVREHCSSLGRDGIDLRAVDVYIHSRPDIDDRSTASNGMWAKEPTGCFSL